ncbi:putative transmembrane protein [Cavenderia fasciculata]|uniref:Transmembrane protein n=1 Tax=Cavenderia fasciculata TaxID=261658 RepID=F4PQ56_CACFS|nr:putative transmembrane protein [Cavenderia fasciculata]EGG22519.1 putative transmembrane protein [Cavenderia fasciculata]|eukprot:XP_004360370.1 putative transmembrane protein [Cavenderia fasciculata]
MWVGSPENDWNDPSNWSPVGIPIATDDVYIRDESNQTTVISVGPVVFGSLIVGNSPPNANETLLLAGGFSSDGAVYVTGAAMLFLGTLEDQPNSIYNADIIMVDTPSTLLIRDANVTVVDDIYNLGLIILDGNGNASSIDNTNSIKCETNSYYQMNTIFNRSNSTLLLKPGSSLYFTGVEQDDTTRFMDGSRLYGMAESGMKFENQSLYTDQAIIELNSSAIATENAYILIGDQTKFNMTGAYTTIFPPSSDSVFASSRSNATITDAIVGFDHTLFFLNNSRFNIFGSSDFYLKDSFILTMGDGGFLSLFESAKMNVHQSTIFIQNYLDLGDLANLNLYGSQIVIAENQDYYSFTASGNSSMTLSHQSSLTVNGIFFLTDYATIQSSVSDFSIKEHMYLQNDSIVQINLANFTVDGLLTIVDRAQLLFSSSIVYINGSAGAYDQSKLLLNTSILYVPGNFTLTSTFLSMNSIMIVNQYFQSAGLYYALETNLLVSGEFHSYGYAFFENTTLISNGTAKFDTAFYGKNANITVQSGDLVFLENSNFTCTNCTISVLAGVFEYQQGTRLELFNTTLTNNGTVSSLGDVSLSPGSSITNTGLFTILSNIIANATTNNETLPAEINNYGSINSQSNVTIDVLINNSGNFSIESNSSIYVQEFTQTDGGNLQLVGGGSITSYLNLNIQGGSVYGNGAINTSLDLNNNGQLGIKNITSELEIHGNLTQSGNSTTVIRINTIDDFTKYKINQTIEVAGTLLVYMNKNLLGNDVNVTIISYNQTSSSGGDFGKIKVLTYDPENNDDEEEVECQVQPTKGERNYSLLLQDCENSTAQSNRNKVIVGAVVGSIVGASVLVASYIAYKKYLAKKLFAKKLDRIQAEMNKL